eukprot:Protomagalhaensia_wolfi_Nauph_80__1172@NODE_1692_length_1396_cov_30_069270_g1314_i0_p1_GENE_NODE_1692_length_1396_cov_30_069270_g1314_i0NODE_1692_length_1396_cov_30_069270_g1314_i0_p1_ORF_typecomplete_len421_score65_75RNA_pol_Rpo13/PF12136_8/6_5e02RNA_pol_Rpo13/PF12136_8/7_6_NODE_1692_length_1396_cov_30_069270_g1314_i0711333
MVEEFLLVRLWGFLCPRSRLRFSHLCQRTRRMALSKENECVHMVECLDLTLGCWRGTGFFKENPWRNRNQSYGGHVSEEEEEESFEGSLHSVCMCVLEDGANGKPLMTSEEAVNWLLMRVSIEHELNSMNLGVPGSVQIKGQEWIRIQDPELDTMNYRLKHFARGFLEGQQIGHKRLLVFKGPRIQSVSETPRPPGSDSPSFDLNPEDQGFSTDADFVSAVLDSVLNYGCGEVKWFESREECFALSPFGTFSTEFEYHDLHKSHVGIPFLVRVLIQEEELRDRLCDVGDSTLTPGSFLKVIHETGGSYEEVRPFGIDALELLLRNTNVYKLPFNDFFNLTNPLGVDPDFQWGDGIMSWLCPSEFALCDMERNRMAERTTLVTTHWGPGNRFAAVTAKGFGPFKRILIGEKNKCFAGIVYS